MDHPCLVALVGDSGKSVRTLRLVLLAVFGCVFFSQALAAVTRPIPLAAKRVVMAFSGGNSVEFAGGVRTLSPGAQIRDVHNRIVLPGAMSGVYTVRALIDNNEQVHRVWILTPEELAAPDPKQ